VTAADMLATRTANGGPDAQLVAATRAQPTTVLLAAHATLTGRANPDAAERLTAATIADVLTARHGLDATLDAIFEDDDYAGTYHDALLAAMATVGATA
jgi:hypothetical protein